MRAVLIPIGAVLAGGLVLLLLREGPGGEPVRPAEGVRTEPIESAPAARGTRQEVVLPDGGEVEPATPEGGAGAPPLPVLVDLEEGDSDERAPTVEWEGEVQRVVSDEGVVLSEVGIRDGVEHGPWIARYESGIVRETGTYEDGVKVGTWTVFWENGGKKQRVQVENGKPVGVAHGWHEGGALERELTFVDGRIEGALRAWHPGGEPHMEVEYHVGELHGECRWWDAQGRLLEKSGRYENGARVGPL